MIEVGGTFGDYEVVRRLGKGAMGEVWLLSDSFSGNLIAAKILDSKAASSEEARMRFLREAELTFGVKHPNLVEVFDVGEDPDSGHCYILMEYVSGGTLADRLKARGALPINESVAVVKAMANVLEIARLNNVVHRDVKPANIMFSADGTPKLADLGIALCSTEEGDSTTMTRADTMMGTPAYMSPEQMIDAHNVDTRADIYSLGIVFYEMLTGVRPNKGCTFAQLLVKSVKGEPLPDVRTVRPDVPASLAHLLNRMIAPDKNVRIAIPAQITDILAAIERGVAYGETRPAENAAQAPEDGRSQEVSHAEPPPEAKAPRRRTFVPRARKMALERKRRERNATLKKLMAVGFLLVGLAVFWQMALKPRRSQVPSGGPVAYGGGSAAGSAVGSFRTCRSPEGEWTYHVLDGKAWLGGDDRPALRPEPEGCVRLPSSLDGTPVAGISQRAFRRCSHLKEVVLPEGYESIGSEAFHGCETLESVIMPKTVRTVGAGAFFGTKIRVLDLGGISEWNPSAIRGMAYLEDLRFGADNREFLKVGGMALSKDGEKLLFVPRGATALTIPPTVVRIEEYACEASSVRSLVMPGGVRTIGGSAFAQCTELRELAFPDSLEALEAGALRGAVALESVRFGRSFRRIGAGAFDGCPALRDVRFSGDAPLSDGAEAFRGAPRGLVVRVKRDSKGWNPLGDGLPERWPVGAGDNARKIVYDD